MKKNLSRIVLAFCCVLLACIAVKSDSQAANKARIQIVDYAIEQKNVISGEEVTLILSIQNRSGISSITDIILTCTSENNLLYPVYGESNQLYISSLEPGQIKEVAIDLKAKDGLQVDSLAYYIDIMYCDEYYADNISRVTLQLPVSTESTLMVHNYSVPDVASQYAKTRISSSFSNGGQSTLSDIVLHIEGVDGSDVDNILPMNSLAGGESNFAEGYVTFQELGEQTITTYFSYTDTDGTEFTTEKKDYVINVVESTGTSTEIVYDGEETADTEITQQDSNLQGYIQIGIFVAILVILVVIVILWRKDKN